MARKIVLTNMDSASEMMCQSILELPRISMLSEDLEVKVVRMCSVQICICCFVVGRFRILSQLLHL